MAYARYHYTWMRKNYISILVTMVALPAFMGITGHSVRVVVDISLPIFLFATIGFALRTTFAMRNNDMRVMDAALPISNGERFAFMLFNLTIAYPLMCAVAESLAILVVSLFANDITLGEAFSFYFDLYLFEWPLYVMSQIIAAGSLLLNISARRRLFVAYIGAFVGILAFFWFMSTVGADFAITLIKELGQSEISMLSMPDYVGIALYVSVPIALYALAYVALRRRQMRW